MLLTSLVPDLFYGMHHIFVCSNGLYLFYCHNILFNEYTPILMWMNIYMFSSYLAIINKNVMGILVNIFGIHVEDTICEGKQEGLLVYKSSTFL